MSLTDKEIMDVGSMNMTAAEAARWKSDVDAELPLHFGDRHGNQWLIHPDGTREEIDHDHPLFDKTAGE